MWWALYPLICPTTRKSLCDMHHKAHSGSWTTMHSPALQAWTQLPPPSDLHKMPSKRNPPKKTLALIVPVSSSIVNLTRDQQENTRSTNHERAPLKIKSSLPKAFNNTWHKPISGTNLIHSQVMRRDRYQCVLCHNDGKYEESRLEIVKVALHKSRIPEYVVVSSE